MLPRRHRLTTQRRIRSVLGSGRRRSGLRLTVRFKAADAQDAAVTFVVSRRVSKLAVVRNRIKRRLRAAIKPHLPQLAHHQAVIIAQPAAKTATYQQLAAEIRQLLTPPPRS